MGAFEGAFKSLNKLRRTADRKIVKRPENRLVIKHAERAARDTDRAARRGTSLIGD